MYFYSSISLKIDNKSTFDTETWRRFILGIVLFVMCTRFQFGLRLTVSQTNRIDKNSMMRRAKTMGSGENERERNRTRIMRHTTRAYGTRDVKWSCERKNRCKFIPWKSVQRLNLYRFTQDLWVSISRENIYGPERRFARLFFFWSLFFFAMSNVCVPKVHHRQYAGLNSYSQFDLLNKIFIFHEKFSSDRAPFNSS